MKPSSRSLSSSSSEEGSVASSSSSPTRPSFLGKLRRILSPTHSKKSEARGISSIISISPQASPGSISPLTASLSINPHAPKYNDFDQVFKFFDEDGDGKISPTELQNCVQTIGGELTPAEAVTAVESVDTDGDGLLGMEDFEKLMAPKDDEDKKKGLREAFAMYEMEGSGCITPTSLNRMLGRLGDSKTIEECTSIIRTFDLNGDGVLSFEEFSAMMG